MASEKTYFTPREGSVCRFFVNSPNGSTSQVSIFYGQRGASAIVENDAGQECYLTTDENPLTWPVTLMRELQQEGATITF